MLTDSTSMPHCGVVSNEVVTWGWWKRGKTYQTAADEEHRDGKVFQVGGAPITAPAAEVLEEDVGRAIEEDQGALDELGRGTPFLAGLLGADVPGLCVSVSAFLGSHSHLIPVLSLFTLMRQKRQTHPSEIAEAAGPAAEGENTQPIR